MQSVDRSHNAFNRLRHGSWCLALGSLLMGGAVQSCTDDVNVNGGILATDGETGITLYLPDIKGAAEFGATRAEDPVNEKTIEVGTGEAEINNMYLFVFDTDGKKVSGTNPINLKDYESKTVENNYVAYTIPIMEGTYKFYLLANLDSYLNGEVESLDDEDAVLKAVLNFKDKVAKNLDKKGLTPGNLPMACLASQMKNAPGAERGSAETVTIVAGKNNAVYADMQFLCSKVRYTILFDKESFSNKFSSTDIDFDNPEVHNVRDESALVSSFEIINPSFTENITDLSLNKVAYPEENSGYLKEISERTEAPDNLSEPDWDENSKQKAWQGIVYLPENSSEEEPSTIYFKGTGLGLKDNYPLKLYWEKEDKTPYGIDRAHFYDIVIKLQYPDKSDGKEVSVFVDDWTYEGLVYQLHGPYELVVESTLMPEVISGQWKCMGFESDVKKIDFEVPKIYVKVKNNNKEEIMEIPFLKVQEITEDMTDEKGVPYNFSDGFSRHLRVTIDPNVPLSVIRALKNGNREYRDAKNNVFVLKYPEGTDASNSELKPLNYFHIIAANLHKKIDIEILDVKASLSVTHQRIVIDMREYFTSGWDPHEIDIEFASNYDDSAESTSFYITDPAGLLKDKGINGLKALYITYESDGMLQPRGDDIYDIKGNEGKLTLNIEGITRANPFWNFEKETEFEMTFHLHVEGEGLDDPEPITVTIVVIPFRVNYIIHFKDNTKTWVSPHIFVYQDLTLPSDMKNEDGTPYKFAGKIVGYVENNESLGPQWNAATQYVFSNDISFRGWKGYGGPDYNDPYAEAYSNYGTTLDPIGNDPGGTMGFVMFGVPSNNSWNFDYSYQKENTYDDARHKRYRYDVKFNEDHTASLDRTGKWACDACRNLPDFNYLVGNQWTPQDDDGRGYPGISMEEEGNGWYKYILTGVAQPGITMLFFANWHEPWDGMEDYKNYAIEDYRFPGDYEAGLQLFDFKNNEAWFLFDGNGTNTDQHFLDHEPTSRLLEFKDEKVQIEYEKPTGFDRIELYEVYYNFGDRRDHNTDNEKKINIDNNSFQIIGGKQYIVLSNSELKGKDRFCVKLYYKDNGQDKTKEYVLGTKNFNLANNTYTIKEPLQLEFKNKLNFMIKWSDNINMGGSNFSYYPHKDGCNFMNIYLENENGRKLATCEFKDKVIGNYKYVYVTLEIPSDSHSDKLIFQMSRDAEGTLTHDHPRTFNIEDLPKYYNPSVNPHFKTNCYQVNWHMLEPMHY